MPDENGRMPGDEWVDADGDSWRVNPQTGEYEVRVPGVSGDYYSGNAVRCAGGWFDFEE